MLWIITEDKINKGGEDDVPSRVGKVVTNAAQRSTAWRAATEAEKDALRKEWTALCNFEFQLFDDDGEHYYSGVCLDLDKQPEEGAFGPLDWARNDAGAVMMQYRKKGGTKWEIL